jgi:toxin ParE1/3/4
MRCSPGSAPGSANHRRDDVPRRLLLSPRAAADLEEIADYIARDNPIRAANFVAELEAKCRAVAASPELDPARADLVPGLRMAVHGRYLVLCRDLAGENTVRVERVLHSARNLSQLF